MIAEEVAKVNPDLVVRDKDGEIYTVRYDQVNAMLLNEFLKEHRKVEQQDRKLQEQETTITRLEFTIAEQKRGWRLYRAAQRAGRANPKSERTARRSESVRWRT